MRLRAAVVAGALLGAQAAAATLPATAHAGAPASDPGPFRSRVAAVPAGGVLQVQGHGWGHGHGMSQWAAEGGAGLGKTATEMLDAFYPGTQSATLAARTLRVWISADDGKDTVVWPAAGLTVTDLSGAADDANTSSPGTLLPTDPPATYARWRVIPTPNANTLTVQYSPNGSSWTTYDPLKSLTGPVRFSTTAVIVRVGLSSGTSRDYRGRIAVVRIGTGSSTTVKTIDVVDREDYLRGVVPRESPSSWKASALQAQAVAARSYVTYEADHPPSATYDICDSDACQVYGGATLYAADGTATPLETTATDQAVKLTANTVRTYQDKAIFAQFSSSDGGWTTAGSTTTPYLNAHEDPWDGVDPNNSGHTWSATLGAADLQQRYPAVGTLTGVEVVQRDGNGEWGGRVQQVLLHGLAADGTVTQVQATGFGVYQAHSWPAAADGMRSDWWQIQGAESAPPPPPGLVALPASSILETGHSPLRAGVTRRVTVSGLPPGATAVLVAVTARGVSPGSGSLFVGPSGGRQVAVAPLTYATTRTGLALVQLPPTGPAALAVLATHVRAGARVQIVGTVVPGGATLVPTPGFPVLTTVNAPATVKVPEGTSLLGVSGPLGHVVTVGGIPVVGTGSALVSAPDGSVAIGGAGPVRISLLAGAGLATAIRLPRPSAVVSTVTNHPTRVTVPGVAAGQTFLGIITTSLPVRVWPAGSHGPMLNLPAGGQMLVTFRLRGTQLLAVTPGSASGVGRLSLTVLAVTAG